MTDEMRQHLSDVKKGTDSGHMRGRKLTEEWKKHISDAQTKHAVICVETGVVYASAYDASDASGACRSHIVSCCTGNKKTIGGFHWAYYDDYLANPEYYADILREYVPHKNAGAKVVCIETGVVYKTAREAMRQTGISNSTICACLSGKRKTAGGYHWKFYDEDDAEGTHPVAV